MNSLQALSNTLKMQNEDIVYGDGSVAWVLDGATGIDGTHISDEASDAYWYVKQLDLHLRMHLNNYNKSITQILKEGMQHIIQTYKMFEGYHKQIDFPSCAGVIVRKHENILEYYVMADCELLIEKTDREVLEIVDHRVSRYDDLAIQDGIQAALERGKSLSECKDAMMKQEHITRGMKNVAYFALSDNITAVDEGLSGTIPLLDIKNICLLSDGFAQYFEVMKLCENANQFMKLCKSNSIEELYNRLLNAQQQDAGLDAHPRFKISDDATILYWRMQDE